MPVCEPLPYAWYCLPDEWPHTGVLADDLAAMTPAQRSAYDAAVEMLAALSPRSFGVCTYVSRPCSTCCAARYGFRATGTGWFTPYLYGGQVYNSCGCQSISTCGCTDSRSSIILAGPVVSITQVRVDGAVVDPGLYELVGNRLVRTDGGVWPMTQDLGVPATQPGTFEVTYVAGYPLSVGGQRALTALMLELFKATCGDQTCRLPARVTNVVREGLTYTLMDDPTKMLNAGRLGIPEVDVWLAALNPHGTRTRMAVYSPDLPGRVR